MKRLLCVLALCWATVAVAGPQECLDATCRVVTHQGATGTAVAYAVADGWVCLMSNAHVVENAKAVRCDFWRGGRQMAGLTGHVYATRKNNDVDAALIAIPVKAFGSAVPKPIPLDDASRVVRGGETVVTVGCPFGRPPAIMPAKAAGYFGTMLVFRPRPELGRSGSAIFDAGGEHIVGLLFGQEKNNPDGYGFACSLQALHAQLAAAVRESSVTLTQCGPGGCPGGMCPVQPESFGIRRQRQVQVEKQITQPTQPWPGIDGTPAQPPADLKPISEKLDKIIANTTPAVPVVPPVPGNAMPPTAPPTDGQMQQLEGAVKANAEGLKAVVDGVPKLVDQKLEPVNERLGRVEKATKPLLTLEDWKESVEAKFGKKPAEDASGQSKFLHDPFVQHAAAIVGVLLVIAFGIALVWRTGRGPIGYVVHQAAEKHPENAKLQAADQRWSSVDAKILADLLATQLGQKVNEKRPAYQAPATTSATPAPPAPESTPATTADAA